MTKDKASFVSGRVVIAVGDITDEHVDAIVNAANRSLLGGGGVDGAIHRAGGPEILEACQEIRRTQYPQGLPTGEAVITTAGNLPAEHVIHTVGPVYGNHDGREAELLSECYRKSLELAVDHSLTSIAFPAISTGVYGYPSEKAAVVASESKGAFLIRVETIALVRLVFFADSHAETFLRHHKFS